MVLLAVFIYSFKIIVSPFLSLLFPPLFSRSIIGLFFLTILCLFAPIFAALGVCDMLFGGDYAVFKEVVLWEDLGGVGRLDVDRGSVRMKLTGGSSSPISTDSPSVSSSPPPV